MTMGGKMICYLLGSPARQVYSKPNVASHPNPLSSLSKVSAFSSRSSSVSSLHEADNLQVSIFIFSLKLFSLGLTLYHKFGRKTLKEFVRNFQ